MNEEKLTWESPQLMLVDVYTTLGGSSPFHTENLTSFPISGS
jgi:hypothetical protein